MLRAMKEQSQNRQSDSATVRGISFPKSQLDWLIAEAHRQEHGNVSRVVQDAVREYRMRQMVEQMAQTTRLERVG